MRREATAKQMKGIGKKEEKLLAFFPDEVADFIRHVLTHESEIRELIEWFDDDWRKCKYLDYDYRKVLTSVDYWVTDEEIYSKFNPSKKFDSPDLLALAYDLASDIGWYKLEEMGYEIDKKTLKTLGDYYRPGPACDAEVESAFESLRESYVDHISLDDIDLDDYYDDVECGYIDSVYVPYEICHGVAKFALIMPYEAFSESWARLSSSFKPSQCPDLEQVDRVVEAANWLRSGIYAYLNLWVQLQRFRWAVVIEAEFWVAGWLTESAFESTFQAGEKYPDYLQKTYGTTNIHELTPVQALREITNLAWRWEKAMDSDVDAVLGARYYLEDVLYDLVELWYKCPREEDEEEEDYYADD